MIPAVAVPHKFLSNDRLVIICGMGGRSPSPRGGYERARWSGRDLHYGIAKGLYHGAMRHRVGECVRCSGRRYTESAVVRMRAEV